MKQHTYIAINLKSFYTSVECRERGLDPPGTNRVVTFGRIADKNLLVRCMCVVANHVLPEAEDAALERERHKKVDISSDS